MSAREELEKWGARHVSGVEAMNFDYLLSAALTEASREAAHELAEKIRAFDGPSITMAGRRVAPLELVADSIDPEVSDG